MDPAPTPTPTLSPVASQAITEVARLAAAAALLFLGVEAISIFTANTSLAQTIAGTTGLVLCAGWAVSSYLGSE